LTDNRDPDRALLFSISFYLDEELEFLRLGDAGGNAASAEWLDLCAVCNNDRHFHAGEVGLIVQRVVSIGLQNSCNCCYLCPCVQNFKLFLLFRTDSW
jgi:hypothetical protein